MPVTYEPLATFSPSGSNAIVFSSIPQTYTDLRVVFHYATDNGSGYTAINLYPNGDATANKCLQSVRTDGSSREAIGSINTINWADYYSNPTLSSGQFAMSVWDIPQYASSTAHKMCVINKAGVPSWQDQISCYWANTSPITSLTFYCTFGNFVAGTVGTLFGIKAA